MAAPVSVPIDQRFGQLIQQFGLTKNSFAISLGKTASVVQHLIDGRNKPGYDLLCRVFEVYPNVSRDWLLLGRGPMLVGGEIAPKPAPAASPSAPEEAIVVPEFEAIEVPPMQRRTGPGVAGSRLQAAEIAATLALAAAANHPTQRAELETNNVPETPSDFQEPTLLVRPAPPIAAVPAPAIEVPVPPPAFAQAPGPPETAPLAGPVTPAANPVPAPLAGPSPESYLGAALQAQHLQHQLAMAEMRNQHLLEQQQMLREMLAMARQGMV
ncbi:helix-turn-helix transcriptional regulator [Hymenobacter sp. IS2118]|uniref:helix-turn-helix transcriptional regulator n=1 Tax=Hymenobacter sp. IS2118 TaxID=1505605 RepID=UPI00068DB82E|nr:helix-turn-helix transcriptional regulator [Hymenobacter sp. IS2118]